MIIHQPEIHLKDETITISARVELQDRIVDLPQYLWFEFPASYQPYLADRSDGFLASLAMLSMYLGEPLEVRGTVSPRLAYGLQQWQAIFHTWYPRQFALIDVKYARLAAMQPQQTQARVASAFSGGLDSLYTLWSNLPANQPNPATRLSHALFIFGFDIRLHQEDKYRLLFRHYQSVLSQVGVTLLSAKTNVYLFSQFRIKWELMHGGPLIGAALLLGRLLGKFLVNSSAPYVNIKSTHFGTSPLSDHWLSTETLEVLHFGSAQERVGKMIAIGGWPLAQRTLRVCTNTEMSTGVNNCGVCPRCVLNKTRLELLGLLPKFTTFTQPFHHSDLLHLALASDSFPGADRMVFKAALAAHRWDIAIPMLLVSYLDRIKHFIIDVSFNRLPKGKRYAIKRHRFASQAENLRDHFRPHDASRV
jgi:hypothetical protein